MNRYQGVIALEGQGFERAAHHYFERSEQIPTLVRLAVGETVEARGRAWRAGGLIVQYLPGSPQRRADFHPGDAPEGTAPHQVEEDDAWTEAQARAATTEAHELIDPTLSGERLLFRLFNERGVRVFEPTRACGGLPLLRRRRRRDAAQLPAGGGQAHDRRRRHDRRHLRILLDQARLRPRRLRRLRRRPAHGRTSLPGETGRDRGGGRADARRSSRGRAEGRRDRPAAATRSKRCATPRSAAASG